MLNIEMRNLHLAVYNKTNDSVFSLDPIIMKAVFVLMLAIFIVSGMSEQAADEGRCSFKRFVFWPVCTERS